MAGQSDRRLVWILGFMAFPIIYWILLLPEQAEPRLHNKKQTLQPAAGDPIDQLSESIPQGVVKQREEKPVSQENTAITLSKHTTWKIKARLLHANNMSMAENSLIRVQELPSPKRFMSRANTNKPIPVSQHHTKTGVEGRVELILDASQDDVDPQTLIVFELHDQDGHVTARGQILWPQNAKWPVADLGDVTLLDHSNGPMVKARIIGSDGSILSNSTIRICERIQGVAPMLSRQAHITSNENGVVRFELTSALNIAGTLVTLEFAVNGRASVRLPTPPWERLINLGDVRLKKTQLLASGIVVDTTGKPFGEAMVSVFSDQDGQSKLIPGQTYHTDKQGHFRIVTDLTVPEFRIAARKYGYNFTLSQPYAIGATGIRIIVPTGGLFSGRVIADLGVPLDSFSFQINTKPNVTIMVPGKDGTFLTPWKIPEGSYTVTCEIPGKKTIEFTDVAIRGGETSTDPRLNPFDMKGKLRTITFYCLDVEKEPIRGQVSISNAEGKIIGNGQIQKAGKVSVAIPVKAKDLKAHILFYSPQELRNTRVSQELVFHRFVRVTSTVEGHIARGIGSDLQLVLLFKNGLSYPGTVYNGSCTISVPKGDFTVHLRIGEIEVPFTGRRHFHAGCTSDRLALTIKTTPEAIVAARQERSAKAKHKTEKGSEKPIGN